MRSRPDVRIARVGRTLCLAFAALTLAATTSVGVVVGSSAPATAAITSGYWLVATDGGVFSFGKAGFHGSTGDIPLNQPIVGMASTPSGRGYWMVAADGGIFAFGDAGFHGSMGGTPLNKPVVAMAPTKTGKGYWMVAADGGIFTFGDARFHGSTGGMDLNKPVVDMAPTPTGNGYWLAATDGGIFSFGDAAFHGSTGDIELAMRIHSMAATPTGRGYWLVAGDGGIFTFGDAGFHGAATGDANKRVLDMAASGSGRGYYITTSEGQVLGYGDAKFHGDTSDVRLNDRIAGITAMNGSAPPVAVDDLLSLEEDGTASLDPLANDHDPDGGTLSLRSVGTPSRGVATAVGNAIIYRPEPDANGNDSFTYTVADDHGEVAQARVSVSIEAVDDKPEAKDDTMEVPERASTPIPVLANDTGLGDRVRSLRVSSEPSDGEATVAADRLIVYTPDAGHLGEDSFEYEVTDSDGDKSTGRVRLEVVDVNDVPVARDDTFSTPAGRSLSDLDVLDNDTSPDGFRSVLPVDSNGIPVDTDDPLPTELGGTFERNGDRLDYSPPRAGMGTDTFRYVIVDGEDSDDPHGGDTSNVATVRVHIGANSPPIIEREASFEVDQGATVRCNRVDDCLAKADLVTDPEGDRLTFRVGTVKPQRGELSLDSDGTFTYGPAGDPGQDSFTFIANDGHSDSEEGTVRITILSPPGPQPQESDPSTTTTTTSGAVMVPGGAMAAAALARRLRRRR